MTTPDRSMGDRSRDEVLAGEYVLGVMSIDDRRKVEARILRDAGFAAIVNRWQENLATFDDSYIAETPPANLFPKIERRIYGIARGEAEKQVGLGGRVWGSLAFWRGLAFASIAVAAGVAVVDSGVLTPASSSRKLVAELAGQGGSLSLVANYDSGNGHLKMTPVAAGKPEEKSLELWMIQGDNPAVSLGVLPQSGEGEVVVPADMRAQFADGLVLAVSLEPYGGSQTGKPTGPVVAVGPAQVK